jgi:hypothetical protein
MAVTLASRLGFFDSLVVKTLGRIVVAVAPVVEVVVVVELVVVAVVGVAVVLLVPGFLLPAAVDAVVPVFLPAAPPCVVFAGDVAVEGFWLAPFAWEPGVVGLDEVPLPAPFPRPCALIAVVPSTMAPTASAAIRSDLI